MKITVLLDNYNYDRFLPQAIESVLQQTYGDFELLIVDDGSTDSSREIISGYCDFRIRAILKENGGQGSAFKAGLAEASGDYVAFLDSDDTWERNKLRRCVEVLEEQNDVVLLNHSYRYIDDEGAELAERHEFRKTDRYSLMGDLRSGQVNFSMVPTSFFVARRKECAQLAFDETKWKVSADTPLTMELALRGPVFNLAEKLGSYRVHGSNLWHGRYNDEVLYKHYTRVYDLVNDELCRQGRRERLNFLESDFAIGRQIMKNSRLSIAGMYYRLRKLGRTIAQRSRT